MPAKRLPVLSQDAVLLKESKGIEQVVEKFSAVVSEFASIATSIDKKTEGSLQTSVVSQSETNATPITIENKDTEPTNQETSIDLETNKSANVFYKEGLEQLNVHTDTLKHIDEGIEKLSLKTGKEEKSSVEKKEQKELDKQASTFYTKGLTIFKGIKDGITGLGEKIGSVFNELSADEVGFGLLALGLLLKPKIEEFLNITFEEIFRFIAGGQIVAFLTRILSGTGRLSRAFSGVVRAFAGINRVTGGLVRIFRGVGRGIRGLVGIFQAISNFVIRFSRVFGTIGRLFGRLFPFTAIIISAIDGLLGFFKGFTETEGSFIQRLLGGLREGLIGIVSGLIETFVDLPRKFLAWVAEKLGFEGIAEALRGFSVSEAWSNLMRSIWTTIQDLIFGNISFSEIGRQIINAAKNLFGIFTNVFSSIINSVKDVINSLIDRIPGIPGWVKNRIKSSLGIESGDSEQETVVRTPEMIQQEISEIETRRDNRTGRQARRGQRLDNKEIEELQKELKQTRIVIEPVEPTVGESINQSSFESENAERALMSSMMNTNVIGSSENINNTSITTNNMLPMPYSGRTDRALYGMA